MIPIRRDRPYFLFVGTIEPRKNVPALVAAWRPLRNEANLVLIGRRREDAPPIQNEPNLECLGAVTDADLPSWYAGATACVYPSLYEGFGLPVLEAMQYGAPVITSKDPAITEIASGAAIQVDSTDINGLTSAMRTVLDQQVAGRVARPGLPPRRRVQLGSNRPADQGSVSRGDAAVPWLSRPRYSSARRHPIRRSAAARCARQRCSNISGAVSTSI